MQNRKYFHIVFENYVAKKNLTLLFLLIAAFVLPFSLLLTSRLFALLPLYIIAFIFLICVPEFLIIVIIVFTSTIFPLDAFPQPISFGDIGLYLPEALIVLLLVRTLLTSLVKRDFKNFSSDMTTPMILLFIWIIFSVANAIISQRTDLLKAILNVRSYVYYANFFLILYYIDTPKKLNFFIKTSIIMATVCAIFSLVQFMIGPETKIFPWFTWVVGSVVYQSKESVARVFPKSLSIIYTALFPVFVSFLNGVLKRKWLYMLFLLLFISAIFISFTRAIHYSAVFGFLIIWLVIKGKMRYRFMRNLITVLLFVFLIIIYLPLQLGLMRVTNWWGIMFERHSEFLSSGTATETLAWRAIESMSIINEIKKSPIIGNGIGATYYHPLYNDNVALAHNGYLSIAFQLGIIGVLIMVFIFYQFIRQSIIIYRRTSNVYYKSLVLGFLVAFISVLPAAYSEPVFIKDYWWISLLGIIWAMPIVISKIGDDKAEL